MELNGLNYNWWPEIVLFGLAIVLPMILVIIFAIRLMKFEDINEFRERKNSRWS